MRSLYDIKCELEELNNMSCKPSFDRPKRNDVIDEDKSVKWNREEIARLREAYDEEVKTLNTNKNKYRDKLYSELYSIIQREVGGNISINDAQRIWNKVYADHHSYGYNEVFSYLDELIDLISDIVNHRNN